jgi:DNA-directed RNA polymerase subunit beta
MAIAAGPKSTNGQIVETRQSFARINEVLPIPNLIDVQTKSFRWFLDEGLKELFAEISPITDFTG